jgi:hypothetical protein
MVSKEALIWIFGLSLNMKRPFVKAKGLFYVLFTLKVSLQDGHCL